MGVATGCGCKEVYRFPHTTYTYSSCICSFYSRIPTFCSFKKMFFVLVIINITHSHITYIYIYNCAVTEVFMECSEEVFVDGCSNTP